MPWRLFRLARSSTFTIAANAIAIAIGLLAGLFPDHHFLRLLHRSPPSPGEQRSIAGFTGQRASLAAGRCAGALTLIFHPG
jgi:hypothetical protein